MELSWQEHILPLPDHDLAWYELGCGPTVLCLSGGPGDDHAYQTSPELPLHIVAAFLANPDLARRVQ